MLNKKLVGSILICASLNGSLAFADQSPVEQKAVSDLSASMARSAVLLQIAQTKLGAVTYSPELQKLSNDVFKVNSLNVSTGVASFAIASSAVATFVNAGATAFDRNAGAERDGAFVVSLGAAFAIPLLPLIERLSAAYSVKHFEDKAGDQAMSVAVSVLKDQAWNERIDLILTFPSQAMQLDSQARTKLREMVKTEIANQLAKYAHTVSEKARFDGIYQSSISTFTPKISLPDLAIEGGLISQEIYNAILALESTTASARVENVTLASALAVDIKAASITLATIEQLQASHALETPELKSLSTRIDAAVKGLRIQIQAAKLAQR